MDRGSSGTSVHPVCSLCCVGTSGQDPRHELRDVPRSRLWPQRSRIRTLSWRSSGPQPGPLDRPGLLTDLITRPPESLNCKGQHSPLLSMDSALNDLPPRTGRLGLKIGRSAANVAVIDADRAAGEVCCCRERSLVLSTAPGSVSADLQLDRRRSQGEPQVIYPISPGRTASTDWSGGTFVTHESEKRCSAESASVNEPSTKRPIASLLCRLGSHSNPMSVVGSSPADAPTNRGSLHPRLARR
jgi:hypothetical protein